MIGKEVEESRPVTLLEALDILEERKKGEDFGYEQQVTYEYGEVLKKSVKMSKDKAVKMKKELEGLGLGEKTAVKIVDIMPINEMQLKQVLLIEKKTLEEDIAKTMSALLETLEVCAYS